MAQNQILIRMTNLADKFDIGQNAPTPYVNIQSLASLLYQKANNGQTPSQVLISETTLTANQLFNQMQSTKLMWRGVDDDTINEPILPLDQSFQVISLEAQRIRTFMIAYVSTSVSTSETQFLSE